MNFAFILNKKSYAFFAILGALYIVLYVFPENTFIRLAIITAIYAAIPIICCSLLVRKVEITGRQTPMSKKWGYKKANLFLQSAVFIFGLVCVWLLAVPLIQDLIKIANSNAPITQSITVDEISGNALTSLAYRTVIINLNEDNQINFQALFFAPGHFIVGRTYEAQYLPTSQIILTAREVRSENKN